MATVKENREYPRASQGQFKTGNPGGPGRPKGSMNRSTLGASELRRRVIESWDRVDGDDKLDALAEDDFTTYFRIIAPLLPKQDPPQSYHEWRERVAKMLAEYFGAREHRLLSGTLLFFSSMQPAVRDKFFEDYLLELDRSEMTEQQCRETFEEFQEMLLPCVSASE